MGTIASPWSYDFALNIACGWLARYETDSAIEKREAAVPRGRHPKL